MFFEGRTYWLHMLVVLLSTVVGTCAWMAAPGADGCVRATGGPMQQPFSFVILNPYLRVFEAWILDH